MHGFALQYLLLIYADIEFTKAVGSRKRWCSTETAWAKASLRMSWCARSAPFSAPASLSRPTTSRASPTWLFRKGIIRGSSRKIRHKALAEWRTSLPGQWLIQTSHIPQRRPSSWRLTKEFKYVLFCYNNFYQNSREQFINFCHKQFLTESVTLNWNLLYIIGTSRIRKFWLA